MYSNFQVTLKLTLKKCIITFCRELEFYVIFLFFVCEYLITQILNLQYLL